jgi:Mrp family chromosome partitioning ATPase
MVRIYEALEQAQRERAKKALTPLVLVPLPEVRAGKRYDVSDVEEREMIRLYKNLENLPTGSLNKVVQFIGAHEGAGTSTIARTFAMVSASRLGKLVVLVDADMVNPQQYLFFGVRPEHTWEDVLKKTSWGKTLLQIGDMSLYLLPISCRGFDPPHKFYSSALVEFWGKLKKKFDLVVVDSSPASMSSEGMSLSNTVDGVVLVVEADKTRRPVARNGLEMIRKSGGNVLGVVFNRHRYYIPESIYRKL